MFAFVPTTPQSAVDLTCFESLPDEDDEHIETLFHQSCLAVSRYYVEEYTYDDCLVPNLQETYDLPLLTSIYDGPLQDLFNDGAEEETEEKKCKPASNIVLKSPPRSPQLRHQLDAAVTSVNIVDQQTSSSKAAMNSSGDQSFWRASYTASADTLLLDLLGGNSREFSDVNERRVPEVGNEQRQSCTAVNEEEQRVPNWYLENEE